MTERNDASSGIGAAFTRMVEQGAGWVVAVLFWFVIAVITLIATAQSGKPWDTLIAAAAAGSQAFFAYMVWRLGQAQYAFTQRVTDRQHKIDAFALRSDAIAKLQELGSHHVNSLGGMFDGAQELFYEMTTIVTRLFSDEAARRSYRLAEAVDEAVQLRPFVFNKDTNIADFKTSQENFRTAMNLVLELYSLLMMQLENETRIS